MLCRMVYVFVGAGAVSSCGGGGSSSWGLSGSDRLVAASASSRSVEADFQGARGKSSCGSESSFVGFGLRSLRMSSIVAGGTAFFWWSMVGVPSICSCWDVDPTETISARTENRTSTNR